MRAPRLAALATIPGREESLQKCLERLRPQVDEIRVVCNGFTFPPTPVLALADEHVCEPVDRLGSGAKLRWAQEWKGLYLACDDDALYPADYAATMEGWVEQWGGRALVTCHGRILRPHSTGFLDASFTGLAFSKTHGAWLNYPGSFGLAFDTRVIPNVPTEPTLKNTEEPTLAVWAQRNQVPIWLVPHEADWLGWMKPKGSTVWAEEKNSGFARRNRVLSEIKHWRIHTPSGVTV